MRNAVGGFSIAFALGATILAPSVGAQPTQINSCQTITDPGSYALVNNLSTNGGDCLDITASFVTINLAGFTISGGGGGTGIAASPASGRLQGIAIRNGSITNFFLGVDVSSADGSIVEGLRLSGNSEGIAAVKAIVKDNAVTGFGLFGINASASVVTGNNASVGNFLGADGFVSSDGTVIGNTATNNGNAGFRVFCPVNLTDNTAVGNNPNLVLNGNGCNNTNNVTP